MERRRGVEEDPAADTATATSAPSSGASEDGALELSVVRADAYRIFGEHARGGIGRVLRAEDRRLHRAVAVKELISEDANAQRRFLREAELTARLQHPSIVPVYEAGQWPDGRPFYAMKFISGRTLKELIASATTLDTRLALLPHVLAVAEAISYAHSRRIIHRDLKPHNVVVGEFGETMVVDWGLGKDLSRGDVVGGDGTMAGSPNAYETVEGAVVGTPAFMPPEQAAGENVDERADIYALGAILYNVLRGRAPYVGASAADALAQLASSDPPPVEGLQPGVPRDLAAIVAHAMARDPARRYATARELADDLKRFQTGQLVMARSYTRRALLLRFVRRHSRVVAIAGLFAAILTAVGVVSLRRVLSERRVARAERARAEARTQDLTLVQARTALDRDPTASIAWLKTATIDEQSWPQVAAIAAEAKARGVARFVLRVPGGGALTSPLFSADGKRLYVDGDPAGMFVVDTNRPSEFVRLSTPELRQNNLHRTADGTHIVSGAMTGQLLDIDEAHGPRVLGETGLQAHASPAPVGHAVATCALDGALRLWDLDAGTSRLLGKLAGGCLQATWSSDAGLVAATARRDGATHVWDVRTGAERRETFAAGSNHGFAWSPSGRYVLTIGNNFSRRATDVRTRAITTLAALPEDLGGDFLPGDRFYDITAEGMLRIWPLAGGAPRLIRAHTAKIEEASLSDDGARLITCSEDETARVWDTRSFVSRTLHGHFQSVLGCTLSRDGKMAVTAGYDSSARLWDLSDDGALDLVGHQDDLYGIDFSSDSKRLATADVRGEIRVWDLATGESTVYRGHAEAVNRVVFFGDNRRLASASEDGTARIWDLARHTSTILPHGRRVLGLFVSRDGSTIVTGSDDGIVRIWDAATGRTRVTVRAHRLSADRVLLSDDGKTLVSGGRDGVVQLMDPSSGRIIHSIHAYEREITGLAFGRGEKSILASGVDGTLREWDRATGAPRQTLRGHSSRIRKIVTAPDGHHVVTGGDDHLVRIWDLDSGTSLALRGHTDGVNGVDFSPDGRYVASVARDSTARVWDARTGKLLLLERGDSSVFRVLFSPDSHWLAYIGWDRRVHAVQLNPKRFVPQTAPGLRAWLDDLTTANVSADGRVESY